MKNSYINLLKQCVMHSLWEEKTQYINPGKCDNIILYYLILYIQKFLGLFKVQLVLNKTNLINDRIEGKTWPEYGETMVSLKRLNNFELAIRDVYYKKIQGDIIECGVWRGGCSIVAKAVMNEMELIYNKRKLYLCDSFEGLPKSNFNEDKNNNQLHKIKYLSVSEKEVLNNFSKYELLDDNVKVIKGFFNNSLPNCEIEKIAVLRLDGDLYSSTMDCLNNLYHKLSKGGIIIIDDYNGVEGCKHAVDEFRKKNNIKNELQCTDYTEVWWKK